MKAIVYPKYGPPDVLQFKEVEKPVPNDGEILVKIYAASANPLDWHFMRASPFFVRLGGGLRKPKDPRLGADFAGRVESVGNNVTQFQSGDEVFGSWTGGFAEYATVPENRLALKPANSSFEEVAAIPVAAITALQGLRDKGQLQSGQKVLVNGASGGVGTFAVGNRSVSDYKRALNPNGTCVIAGFSSLPRLFEHMVLGPLRSKIGNKKVGLMGIAKINQKDLVYLKELVEASKVVPVIDRCYPLCETAEAIRYLEEGHAQGKVVITVEQNNHT